jgi:hypothetical protein
MNKPLVLAAGAAIIVTAAFLTGGEESAGGKPAGASITWRGVVMEPDFSHSEMDKPLELAALTAELVKANGYRCDTVHSIYRFLTGPGFTLRCNQGRYKYDVADRGGHWVVTVK